MALSATRQGTENRLFEERLHALLRIRLERLRRRRNRIAVDNDVKVLLRKGTCAIARLDHDGSGIRCPCTAEGHVDLPLWRGHPGAHAGEACANGCLERAGANITVEGHEALPSTTEDLRRGNGTALPRDRAVAVHHRPEARSGFARIALVALVALRPWGPCVPVWPQEIDVSLG